METNANNENVAAPVSVAPPVVMGVVVGVAAPGQATAVEQTDPGAPASSGPGGGVGGDVVRVGPILVTKRALPVLAITVAAPFLFLTFVEAGGGFLANDEESAFLGVVPLQWLMVVAMLPISACNVYRMYKRGLIYRA